MSSTASQTLEKELNSFALDVFNGLSKIPKSIPCKYFYDDRGSELFEAITRTRDYYPTSCESEIIDSNKYYFRKLLSGEPFNFVELGSGNAKKTERLVECFVESSLNFAYIPNDISSGAMKSLTDHFYAKFPDLDIRPQIGDYRSIGQIKEMSDRRNFVMFQGSSLGNFTENESIEFLRRISGILNPGDFLVLGFDLKKDPKIINRAYNDSDGVTSEFNLNLLRRINSEIGGNFDLTKFRHYAFYNEDSSNVEMWIISEDEQNVHISSLGKHFHFSKNEGMHTEYSHKYTLSEIGNYARRSGFKIKKNLLDHKKFFCEAVCVKQ